MSNILLVTSSIFGENSKSRVVAHDILERLETGDPAARVRFRGPRCFSLSLRYTPVGSGGNQGAFSIIIESAFRFKTS